MVYTQDILDALSRRTKEPLVMEVSVSMVVDWEVFREENAQDEGLSKIRTYLLKDSTNNFGYSLEGHKLLY